MNLPRGVDEALGNSRWEDDKVEKYIIALFLKCECTIS
jgi:hypothetical protein